MLTIDEVIAKVNSMDDPICAVIKDGHIYYLVLNDHGDFMFNDVNIPKLELALELLENHTPGNPGCLVTISTGSKKFCTGFDIQWMQTTDVVNRWDVIARFY